MQTVKYRQLLPAADAGPRETDALELVASLPSDRPAGDDLPYLVMNFVASADGRVTVEGRSGALGDPGDKDLFRALRERADAVLAGTVTMAIERYGRPLAAAERRERRVAAGRSAEPIATTISRSGSLPLDIPLFAEAEARVVVFSPVLPDLTGAAAQVTHERCDPEDATPLITALRTLKRDHGVGLLLCEGGPTLFNGLLAEGLVDELFLTVAPKLTGGGSGPSVTHGPPLEEIAELELLSLLEREGTLFSRYRLRDRAA